MIDQRCDWSEEHRPTNHIRHNRKLHVDLETIVGKEVYMEDNSSTASQKIAAQNDEFRKTGKGGRVMLTAGINALGHSAANTIISLVRTFNDFNENNDPYAEHDFGSFMDGGLKVFWKIECYDRGLQFASPDPTNPDVTMRVMTIMRADEY